MKSLVMALVLGMAVVGFSTQALAGEDDGALTGTVINAETGEPVEGALVFVRICTEPEGQGGMGGVHLYSDTTDELGEFYIADLPAGEWTAIARKRLEGRDEETIVIEAGAETVVAFELVKGEVPGGLMYQVRQHGND